MFEICACQFVFDERAIRVRLVESLQKFDSFFRVALCQKHVALQPAAIDVFRIAAKDIFKQREGLVVFLVLKRQARPVTPSPGDNPVPAWSFRWQSF